MNSKLFTVFYFVGLLAILSIIGLVLRLAIPNLVLGQCLAGLTGFLSGILPPTYSLKLSMKNPKTLKIAGT